jgi:hypothetical protein
MRADGCLPRRANAQEVTTRWYIGIDVHKKMCNACIKDLEGNIQKELELRSLVRHRITLTRDMTRVKNRIHAILDNYELESLMRNYGILRP